MNQTLHELIEYDADGQALPYTIIPFIDGGSEGFSGQVRVVIPPYTACFKCGSANFTQPTTYPMCTIKNIPRLPEHCVMYALEVVWQRLVRFESASDYELSADEKESSSAPSFDGDNLEHMSWLFHRSCERARQFGLAEPSYELTMKVAKNIIPAIASTNALISAAACNEGLRVVVSVFCSHFTAQL